MNTMTDPQTPALFHVKWVIDASADSHEDAATDQVAQYFKVEVPFDALTFLVQESKDGAPVVTVDAFQALVDGNAPVSGEPQKEYKISWEISIEAVDAEQAARKVFAEYFMQNHQANAFYVRKDGESSELLVDLMDIDSAEND